MPKKPAQQPAQKMPYQTPVLKDWGTLKDITLQSGSGGKSDNAKGPYSRTN
jgi:hypothetical protein